MKKNKRLILVPYDFETRSEIALENALQVGIRLQSHIHLISVIPQDYFFKEWFKSDKEERQIIRKTHAELRNVAQKAKEKSGLKITTGVEKGRVEEIVLELAHELNVQYIVMGKMHSGSSTPFFFNSQNMSVIAKSPCPVMITGNKPINKEGFKNIVLPLDLTKQTTKKLKRAILWAKYYNATIHLVGVLRSNVSSTRSKLYEKMDKICHLMREEGVVCTHEIYEKSEKLLEDQILEHVEKVNGDVIMIMTHQERSANDNYIGKVAQEIITKSNIPVVSCTSAAMGTIDKIFASFLPFEIFSSQKKV